MPILKGESIEIDGYKYDILDLIDKGGLSTVFLAKEVATGETVAIKEYIYNAFYNKITLENDIDIYWETEIINTIAQSKSGYPCVKIIRYEKRPDLQTPEYYIVMSFIEGMTFLDFYRDFVTRCRGLEHLDIALKKFFDQKDIKTVFSGRTDAGVHAESQPVTVKVEKRREIKRTIKALNSLLPEDIRASRIRRSPSARCARRR